MKLASKTFPSNLDVENSDSNRISRRATDGSTGPTSSKTKMKRWCADNVPSGIENSRVAFGQMTSRFVAIRWADRRSDVHPTAGSRSWATRYRKVLFPVDGPPTIKTAVARSGRGSLNRAVKAWPMKA